MAVKLTMLNSLCVIVIIMYKDNEIENGHTKIFIVSAIFLLSLSLAKETFQRAKIGSWEKIDLCEVSQRHTNLSYRILFTTQYNKPRSFNDNFPTFKRRRRSGEKRTKWKRRNQHKTQLKPNVVLDERFLSWKSRNFSCPPKRHKELDKASKK